MVTEEIFGILSLAEASTKVSKRVASVEINTGSFLYQEAERKFSPNFQELELINACKVEGSCFS